MLIVIKDSSDRTCAINPDQIIRIGPSGGETVFIEFTNGTTIGVKGDVQGVLDILHTGILHRRAMYGGE